VSLANFPSPRDRAELRTLLSLSAPVVTGQLAFMLLGFVDVVMVGHYATEALAAATLANVWLMGSMMFFTGILMGLDPLISQAHGAGDGARCGLAFQRGLVLACLLAPLLALAWYFTEPALRLVGQTPELAREAGKFARVQIPSAPFLLGSMAIRSYLQGRGIVLPSMWVALVANLWNAGLAWLLIYGHFGAPELGLVGAGLATALTRVLSFAAIALIVRRLRLTAGAWTPWSARAFERRGLVEIARIGTPIAIQTCLEVWAFSSSALIAGRLGEPVLAGHSVIMNLSSISFMVPLGLSIGASIRVGNLIGAGRAHDAQHTAWLAIGLGASVMACFGLNFLIFRAPILGVYTSDAAVHAVAASILPIAAAFQVFDGTQSVCCGVLRGMGRTTPAAVANFLGYWLLSLPVGGWFALQTEAGIRGLWWGFACGLLVVAISLVAWISARGPATLARAPETA
jgi:MATE family multidrug resistance protein